MAETIRDVMTSGNLVTLSTSSTATEAAQRMRDQGIGDVIITDDSGNLQGIVTDRDITVRAVAEGRNPSSTTLGDIATLDLVTLTPDDSQSRAVEVMREKALRRIVITEGSRPVGIVSIGDLAIERDSDSALAQISEAPPNN